MNETTMRVRMQTIFVRKFLCAVVAAACGLLGAAHASADDPSGVVAYWKLAGDCRDHSGHGHDGVNHGVDLQSGAFDGKNAYVEVADAPDLHLGAGDFSVACEVYTEAEVADVFGDVLTKFDPASRDGFSLTLCASNPGYNSQSNVRNLFFGLDNGSEGSWSDCGRPRGGRAAISDAPSGFGGKPFCGTS